MTKRQGESVRGWRASDVLRNLWVAVRHELRRVVEKVVDQPAVAVLDPLGRPVPVVLYRPGRVERLQRRVVLVVVRGVVAPVVKRERAIRELAAGLFSDEARPLCE